LSNRDIWMDVAERTERVDNNSSAVNGSGQNRSRPQTISELTSNPVTRLL
jgi:hypothetical protein